MKINVSMCELKDEQVAFWGGSVCSYPIENLQVEGVSSFQYTLIFQDLQRHVSHVRIRNREAVLPQTPVLGTDTQQGHK